MAGYKKGGHLFLIPCRGYSFHKNVFFAEFMKKLLLYSSFFIKSAFITVFMKCRTPEAAEGPPGVLFVFKTPISAKKIQKHEILLCKKSLFSLHKQIKKFRTKNPDFGTFLYGIRCFGAFYTKLTCYLFSFSFSSGWKSAKVERFVSFPNIQV